MSKVAKITTVAVLVLAVCIVIVLKQRTSPALVAQDDVHTKALPRVVDLGAGKCIPCKLMAPILEELRNEYAGCFTVDVFDVEKNPDIAEQYDVRIIPTQIFFDASGKELFRHEGFMSKENILDKWKDLGVNIEKGQKNENPN